ncbi:sigma-54-dependent Fis family transcriptional regulator, partial [bacterium]|nr:sigma-54-dependent Fis family transcriptional regulator [bacterium]
RLLQRSDYNVLTAGDGEEAIEVLRDNDIPVVLTDLMMPKMGGVELLKAAKVVSPATEVVIVTGHGTVETAVEAMKEGAYDFIEKPFTKAITLNTVRKAFEKHTLKAENIKLRKLLEEIQGGDDIIGKSEIMRRVIETAKQVSRSTATILLLGESGTGKEVFANSIHRWSDRAERTMVKVNCAAIPESLLEAELFGYEKGAFTGAVGRREGRFEAAHGGTIFLDEVGEMDNSVQVKLLRVLQEGVFERLGSNEPIEVDVRVLAATNSNLEQRVEDGTFREDLFYRLNVISLDIPPLRLRSGDTILMANFFLKLANEKNKKSITGFTPAAIESLRNYSWPGNVRELENCIERAVVLCKGDTIDIDVLPAKVLSGRKRTEEITIQVGTALRDAEMQLLQATLDSCDGDKELAAKILGIASRTIYRKLK